VFILVVDPTNSILKLKNIVFILFVALSALRYPHVKIYAVLIIAAIYLIIVISFISGYVSLYKFDYSFTLGILKGFSSLILLFWIDKYRIIDRLTFPSLVICLIVIYTSIVFRYKPSLFNGLYAFFMSHDTTMMTGRRTFLGREFVSFFYKSLPVLIIPASIYTYKSINTKGQGLKYFIMMSLLLITLFLGGTRACMLAVVVIIAFNVLLRLSLSNLGKLLLIPIFVTFITIFSVLIFSLIAEKSEASNKIKFANLDSYSELLIKHPTILLSGQGAGSIFYSKGRHSMVVQTEWSYLEILRMFGIIGAAVIVVLFFYPLYLIYKKRKLLELWVPAFLGYVLYLFVGGTNPLLLGSTGMLIMLSAYSYALNPSYELKEW
jgi:hypothetical protein